MVGSKIVGTKLRCLAKGLSDVLIDNDRSLVNARVTAYVTQLSLQGHSVDTCARQQKQLPTYRDNQKPPPSLVETTNNDSMKQERQLYCPSK